MRTHHFKADKCSHVAQTNFNHHFQFDIQVKTFLLQANHFRLAFYIIDNHFMNFGQFSSQNKYFGAQIFNHLITELNIFQFLALF